MKIFNGFTLVEMAIVLIIIGLLMGGLLAPLSMQMDQNQIKATQRDLKTIKEGLLGFAVINGRLPCPDTNNNGGENYSTPCDIEGDLPWATLALDIGKTDAWGQPFRYRVDAQYTNEVQSFPNPPNTSSDLRLRDRENNPLTNESGVYGSDVIAIIISLGKDGQANEENGGTMDNIYTQDMYVENAFDDLLIFLPKTILISRLVNAGQWH